MERLRLISCFLAIFVALVIFVVSSFSISDVQNPGLSWKSFSYHFGIFFFFGSFLFLALGKKDYLFIFFILLVGMIYGCMDELHQYLVPGRSTSIFDFFVDSFGVIAGLSFVYFWKRV